MPNDLLELSLEQVSAVVAGYTEREFDAISHCVLTGYYTGYYMGAKRPKGPGEIIRSLLAKHNKQSKHESDAPDIAHFKEMEARFARSRLGEMTNGNGDCKI